MDTTLFKLAILAFLIPFFFHLIAGIRHLLSDIHVGDSLRASRTSAWLTFMITAMLVLLAGIWLW